MKVKIALISLLICYFIIVIFSNFSFPDPDLGWHLKTGELIASQGIPTTDPFSYTMPSFAYIDHSWLPDVINYQLFKSTGLLGLIVLYFLPALVSLILVLLLGQKKQSFKVLGALLGITVLLTFTTTRPLVLSWVLFALTFLICLKKQSWEKFRYLLPLLFLVWANSHGGFIIGLFLLALKLLSNFWISKKIYLKDSGVFILSLLATFFNPYGLGLWKEVIVTLVDPGLRTTIQEWQPGIISFNPALAILATLTATFTWRYRKEFGLFPVLLFFSCLIGAITSSRNIPYLTIISLPLLIEGLNYFFSEAKSFPQGQVRVRKVYKILFTLVTAICLGQMIFVTSFYMGSFDKKYYPAKAVEFLRKNKPVGNLFAPYNWGGYLIWTYPEKKVFIDGRMPSWSQEIISNESSNAFKDYLAIGSGKEEYPLHFQKYGITTVLWFLPTDQANPTIEEKVFQSLGLSKNFMSDYSFTKDLENDGWERIYQDEKTVIYTQPRD